MKRAITVPFLALLASACTTNSASADPVVELASIRFETTGCHGVCPSFTAEVTAGGGDYVGNAFVAHNGPQAFGLSLQEFASFEARLAPFRPQESVTYDWDNCDGPVHTDSPSVKITWTGTDDQAVSLNWYMGCEQPKLTEHFERIYRAWQNLPELAQLVGSDDDRSVYEGF